MPELPEVEFAAQTLRGWLTGHRIERAEVDRTRVVRGQSPGAVAAALTGRTLIGIDRRAKFLMMELDGGVGVLSHLGMSGKWLRRTPADPPSHSRLRLFLDDGSVIHYRDPRMFGHLQIVPVEKLRKHPRIAALGPDPLAEGLTPEQLQAGLKGTKRPIKVALLDQRVVAGIGNIQAAEALYLARIAPTIAGGKLTPQQITALTRAIHTSIARTLKAQAHPSEIEYVEEGAANPFRVYGREGERCRRCGETFRRIVQAGRSTFYCPGCQPSRPTRATHPRRRAS